MSLLRKVWWENVQMKKEWDKKRKEEMDSYLKYFPNNIFMLLEDGIKWDGGIFRKKNKGKNK